MPSLERTPTSVPPWRLSTLTWSQAVMTSASQGGTMIASSGRFAASKFFYRQIINDSLPWTGSLSSITILLLLLTWAHLPYKAVLKSVHRTATVCSSIRTFFCGSKLPTVAVLWTLAKTANHGSSMDTFRSSCA